MPRLDPAQIPDPVLEVCRTLESKKHRAWVVGGCVRDLLMGRTVNDWDLATTALPREVQRTFRRTIPTGIAHGTVTVLHRGEPYEVTTLRGDGAYSDGRRPDDVSFVGEIEEDLARRDFTVNAIAYDPLTGDLVDPWGGLADMEAGLIRAVRNPHERFAEDGLRVLRAARFCASLELDLEAETEAAIAPSLPTFAKVSPERVHEEWRKAFEKSAAPSRAFAVMRRTGILGVTSPALAELDDERFAQTLARMDRCPREHDLRLAALLYDVPAAPGFPEALLRALKCSNQERKRVTHLVTLGRPPRSADTADVPLRRWLRSAGHEAFDDVFVLAEADGLDRHALHQRARRELDAGLPLATKELPVGGGDVMAALDQAPGRAIGLILEHLLEWVYEDPSRMDADALRAQIPKSYEAVSA